MKRLWMIALLTIAGCTPAENEYCNSFGLPQGGAEYQKCLGYYFEQQSAFQNDRYFCEAQADVTYPPSLYSQPQSYPVRYYGGYGNGGFAHTEMVHVGADYQQNAALDDLRMQRIIQPCMQSRGWNSGLNWQAGRHAPAPAPAQIPLPMQTPAPGNALPWLQ